MFYNNLKSFIKKFPNVWKLLTVFKDYLNNLSRLKDVIIMMLLFHIWPEQVYRFSTRKCLPSKKNRYIKQNKLIIPYELLDPNISDIKKMKEISIIVRGSSFDLNNIKKINGPIFLSTFWAPLRIDDNGKIFYNHGIPVDSKKSFSYKKLFEDLKGKEYKRENITYLHPRLKAIELFKKNGNKVLSVEVYNTNKNFHLYPLNKDWLISSYLNLFDHNQCKRIRIAEKVYKPPLLSPYLNWAPTGSCVPEICALSYFAEKVNVYGWDYYLDSSPENMSYWQLFFNMYKYKHDLNKSFTHFETPLINYYYGYQFSKSSNIKIHGYMGKLEKHKRLIKKMEKILFN